MSREKNESRPVCSFHVPNQVVVSNRQPLVFFFPIFSLLVGSHFFFFGQKLTQNF